VRALPQSTAASLAVLLLAAAVPAAPALGASSGVTVVQRQGVRLALSGSFTPRALPRKTPAPVTVSVAGTVTTADGRPPPQMQTIEIDVNRYARFDFAGLPTCTFEELQPSTTASAQVACGAAKVGEGTFSASVAIPEQSPFPSNGKLVAYNGVEGGKPVIFAHVYGTEPIPTSYTLPLRMSRGRGSYGTVLRASLPQVTSSVAFVTGISLRLHRIFRYRGERRSYLSAACAAPAGLTVVPFPLARASFGFSGGLTLSSTLARSCRAKG
jgi:hypothetical protein